MHACPVFVLLQWFRTFYLWIGSKAPSHVRVAAIESVLSAVQLEEQMIDIGTRTPGLDLRRWTALPEPFLWTPGLAELLNTVWNDRRPFEQRPLDTRLEETDDAFTLELDLPGVAGDDIVVELTGRTLSIRGERKEREKTGTVHANARVTGAFAYTVSLPAVAEEGNVVANLHDGVLTVRVPKSTTVSATRIPVNETAAGATSAVGEAASPTDQATSE